MNLPQLKDLQGKELQEYYDEKTFWEKVAELVKNAAKEVLEKALWLFYAAESPETPAVARYTAYGANTARRCRARLLARCGLCRRPSRYRRRSALHRIPHHARSQKAGHGKNERTLRVEGKAGVHPS